MTNGTKLLIAALLLSCAGPVCAGTALDQLGGASFNAGVFDGSRPRGGTLEQKPDIKTPEAASAREARQPGQEKTAKSVIKKVAPYAYVGAVALVVGWALVGFTWPALLVAGVVVMLAIAAKAI